MMYSLFFCSLNLRECALVSYARNGEGGEASVPNRCAVAGANRLTVNDLLDLHGLADRTDVHHGLVSRRDGPAERNVSQQSGGRRSTRKVDDDEKME